MDTDTKALDAMLVEHDSAPRIYRASAYWERLNRNHADQIKRNGLLHFKRSVNLKYFNWRVSPILRQQLGPVLAELARFNLSPFFRSEFPNHQARLEEGAKGFTPRSAFIYRVFVAAFADYLSRRDPLGLLQALEEPLLGDPYLVIYRGRRLSQDLLNSIHEFYSATEAVDERRNLRAVADIGAGYGRLAYVFIKALPDASYTIIDIPPALFVAQEYLSSIFPGERVFRFRPFQNFATVQREFEAARIRFLMAHQIELLPARMFDLVINASSFQEMRRDQIANYIGQVARIGKGFFYTKQWKRSHIKDNDFITAAEYPAPQGWHEVYRRRHPIQRQYFEALYRSPASEK